ncbi:MAG: hypothetical protein KF749_04215 [Bacteroidetes bacterium]|nr:hypothetical protein [Bacteroidota bacterium]
MALALVARACLLVSVLFTRQELLAQFNILDHRIQTYSVEDGLSQSSIWCIIQDSQGFMWFGTADGLNRFDGYTFKVYRHDARDSSSLRSNTVWSLLEDRAGRIWVGTLQGLHRFDRRTETFSYLPDDAAYHAAHLRSIIYSLVEDRDGNIWISSAEGVSVLDSSGRLREYHATDLGLKADGENVRAHFVDDEGNVWLSMPDRIMKYEYASKRFVSVLLPGQRVEGGRCLYMDKAGILWMGSSGASIGLYALDPANNTWRKWGHESGNPGTISSDVVKAVCADEEGRLWIGTTSGGLNVFDEKKNRFTRIVPYSPTNTFYDKVASVCRDRSGLIWVGYDGAGVVMINPRRNKFKHILLPPSRKTDTGDNFFKALMVDRENRVWLGMYNQGVAVLDRKTGNVKRLYDEFSGPGGAGANSVFALFEDSRSSVWVGTVKGLYRADASSKRFREYDLRGIARDDSRGRIITAFCEDSSGDVWVGSATGVLRYDRQRDILEPVLTLDRIDTSYVAPGALCFAADRNGIWCGSLGIGLLRFSPDGQLVKQYKSHPRNANSISHNSVKTICVDPDGILWIGTEDGLNRFDPVKESWRRYGTADGLPNDFIYGVLMDHHRNLWISTNRGLSKMTTADPEKPRFRNYAVHDGLQSSEFNTNTYFQTAEGEMFFGGVNGFNAFFPDSVKDNPVLPKVVLTRFKKFDQPAQLDEDISAADNITLSYNESVFSFEFAGLEFTNPQENRYAYMMEGFDKGWVFCGKRREARYTNLDPGEYVFRVKAGNNDGVWNEAGTLINVTIVPPFWRTGWFIGLMAALGVVTFGGTVRFISTQKLKKRIAQLEREKEFQEERLRTRERIARDLHDDLASTVGSAGFFIESVKGQLKDIPAQSKEFLDRTSSLLTEAEEAMSDIVWSVSPNHDTLESLLARIRLTTADMCRAHQLKYEVNLAEHIEGITITENVRRNVDLIFKESLANAVRHAGASLISVAFVIYQGGFELIVEDNGKGMPATGHASRHTKRGHGLRNMTKRAEEIDSELSFEHAITSGTIVRLKGRITQSGH